MSIIPQTTCTHCRHQYDSTHLRCPHCGKEKPRDLRRAVPEADSAVRDTAASARAAESLNWQLLFGSFLVLAVLAVAVAIVSLGIGKNVEKAVEEAPARPVQSDEHADNNLPSAAATAVPTPTQAPTPVPSATPAVSMLSIMYLGSDMEGFTEQVGDEIQLDALKFPIDAPVEVVWTSTDESVATVDDTGLVTLVGTGNCYITATAGEQSDRCQVICNR